MDDVDAVQAQIARNMLTSGDWVTARLDGIPYLEKSPLIYWLIAGSFKIFGATDVVARIPVVLAALGLAWLTTAFAMWALDAVRLCKAGSSSRHASACSFYAHSGAGCHADRMHRAFDVDFPPRY